jgi:hypothetical protein
MLSYILFLLSQKKYKLTIEFFPYSLLNIKYIPPKWRCVFTNPSGGFLKVGSLVSIASGLKP